MNTTSHSRASRDVRPRRQSTGHPALLYTPLAFANSRVKNAKGDWDIMIMNGNAHSGEEWKEWKKNNGKTETDPELW